MRDTQARSLRLARCVAGSVRMTARYQTPPPKVRPFSPASPNRSGEVTITLIMVDGTEVGKFKTMREARMIDMYDKLMSALGGSVGHTFEPQLVTPDGNLFDGAYLKPFVIASDGDVYTLVKARLRDTAYVDRGRRSK